MYVRARARFTLLPYLDFVKYLPSCKYSGIDRRCQRLHTALLSRWPAAITTAHTGPFMPARGGKLLLQPANIPRMPMFPHC